MLSCKFIVAEDSPHLTIQCLTFQRSLGRSCQCQRMATQPKPWQNFHWSVTQQPQKLSSVPLWRDTSCWHKFTSRKVQATTSTHLQFSPQLALVTPNAVHYPGDVPEVGSEFSLPLKTDRLKTKENWSNVWKNVCLAFYSIFLIKKTTTKQFKLLNWVQVEAVRQTTKSMYQKLRYPSFCKIIFYQ